MKKNSATVLPVLHDSLSIFIPNIILIVIVLSVIAGGKYFYNQKVNEITFRESRYITTEWHLLQALKQETDRQLQEKDLEIEYLRRRYQELHKLNSQGPEIAEVAEKLRIAMEERQLILDRRLITENLDSKELKTEENVSLQESTSRVGDSLLRAKIKHLEQNLQEDQRFIEKQDETFQKLISDIQLIESRFALLKVQAEDSEKKLSLIRERLSDVRRVLHDRLAAITESSSEEQAKILESLSDYQLVRALLSQPSIRGRYPDLVDNLDTYINDYGIQMSDAGRQEAWQESLDMLELLKY